MTDTPRSLVNMLLCVADTPCSAANTSRGVTNTATLTAFTLFLANLENWEKVFSAFLGVKKHFFQKVLKKWSSIQKIENIFITFYGGAFPKSIILDSLFALFSLVEIWSY